MKWVIFFGAHVMSLKSSVNLLTMDSLTYKKLPMSILPMEFFVRDPINKIITNRLLVWISIENSDSKTIKFGSVKIYGMLAFTLVAPYITMLSDFFSCWPWYCCQNLLCFIFRFNWFSSYDANFSFMYSHIQCPFLFFIGMDGCAVLCMVFCFL
jgi:hypothetical protein